MRTATPSHGIIFRNVLLLLYNQILEENQKNNMRIITLLSLILCIICLIACNKPDFENKDLAATTGDDLVTSSLTTMPNILLLVADDVGYEVPAYTGGESYQTPHIDSLAWA